MQISELSEFKLGMSMISKTLKKTNILKMYSFSHHHFWLHKNILKFKELYLILGLFKLNLEELKIKVLTYCREQCQGAKYELMEHGGFPHLNQCFELIRILLLSCLILL